MGLKRGIERPSTRSSRSSRRSQGGRGQGGHRARRHGRVARARDRRRHRRRDREGRQGRRRERRGGPDLRARAQSSGMQFDKGYLSPYMITDPERMEAELEEPYVLIANQKIGSQGHPPGARAGHPGPEAAAHRGRGRRGESLATIVVNKLRGTFTAVAVKAPGFGDRRKRMLEDIAIITGEESSPRNGPQARPRSSRGSARPARSSSTRTRRRSSTAPARPTRSRATSSR